MKTAERLRDEFLTLGDHRALPRRAAQGQPGDRMRYKLDDDADRIQRQIGQHVSFSQSIVDLAKIVSDGMTAIKTMAPEVRELPKANPADLNKR